MGRQKGPSAAATVQDFAVIIVANLASFSVGLLLHRLESLQLRSSLLSQFISLLHRTIGSLVRRPPLHLFRSGFVPTRARNGTVAPVQPRNLVEDFTRHRP